VRKEVREGAAAHFKEIVLSIKNLLEVSGSAHIAGDVDARQDVF